MRTLENAGVRIVDAPSVATYLACHPDIAAIATDVCRRVVQEFGGASQVSLELYRDPETPDRFLAVFVRQTDYQSDILNRTIAIMEEFGDRLANASGWIQVTTDFQPPR